MTTTTTTSTDNWKAVEAAGKAVLPDPIVAFINECRQKPQSDSYLISILHRVQGHFGYLGREQLDAVAQLLQVPASTVTGVATFYHFFRLEKKGRNIISVCLGTACYVKGAPQLVDRIRAELGIDFGETTKDGRFSLEESRCFGTCGLAPVLMINDEVHGKVTPDQIPVLLSKYT
jgi:NADH:ubiquinone oxidoreductase subunit E